MLAASELKGFSSVGQGVDSEDVWSVGDVLNMTNGLVVGSRFVKRDFGGEIVGTTSGLMRANRIVTGCIRTL